MNLQLLSKAANQLVGRVTILAANRRLPGLFVASSLPEILAKSAEQR